jgi:hypothetical protein
MMGYQGEMTTKICNLLIKKTSVDQLPLLQEAESFERNAISSGTQGRPFLVSPAITS